ncbi:MAG: lipoprotein [Curvibacter sp.]|nr:lipoprotein [Curvibacter sp.]
MLSRTEILVRPVVLVLLAGALSACGQRGPLYLPKDPVATNRATLPQSVIPDSLRTQPDNQTGESAPSPAPTPAPAP